MIYSRTKKWQISLMYAYKIWRTNQMYHVSRFQVLSNKKFSFAYDEFVK